MLEAPGPMKRNITEEEPGSGSKRRKVEKQERALTRKKGNEILRSQKVLTVRVFDSWIFKQPRMVELVEYVI